MRVNIALIFMVVALCFCAFIDLSQPSSTTPTTTPTPTPTTTAPLAVVIVLDSNTYRQGDVGFFQLNSTTTPTGKILMYNSTDTPIYDINIIASYWYPTGSGDYFCDIDYAAHRPYGAPFLLSLNALLGTWSWNATFTDGVDQQTFTGTFTVVARNTQPTPTPTVPFTVTISPDSDTYYPGDVGYVQANSTATPTGKILMYDPANSLRYEMTILASYWLYPSGYDIYVLEPRISSETKPGYIFQLSASAPLGTWTWNATFTDGVDQQTFTGTFTVVARN